MFIAIVTCEPMLQKYLKTPKTYIFSFFLIIFKLITFNTVQSS